MKPKSVALVRLSRVFLGMLLVGSCARMAAAEKPTYLPGFVWDWRVDFGKPSEVSKLPPNPNSDYLSRSLPSNKGLSSGPQADSVWFYGNAPYASLTEGKFTASNFALFKHKGTHKSEGRPVYFWSDSDALTGDWDSVVYIPPPHPLHPGHSVSPDSRHAQAVVLKWVYPGQDSVWIRIKGVIRDGAKGQDGVDFYLLKNSSANVLGYIVLPDGESRPVNVQAQVGPGDEIFMAVGYLQNDGSDTTLLDLAFEVVKAPVSPQTPNVPSAPSRPEGRDSAGLAGGDLPELQTPVYRLSMQDALREVRKEYPKMVTSKQENLAWERVQRSREVRFEVGYSVVISGGKVLQVIGSDTMLIRHQGKVMRLRAVATEGVVDGSVWPKEGEDGEIVFIGTWQYVTVLGGTSTVLDAIPLPLYRKLKRGY